MPRSSRGMTARANVLPLRECQFRPERGKAAGEGAAQGGHHLGPRHDAVADGGGEQAVDGEYRNSENFVQ
jgi:hypothetical protein